MGGALQNEGNVMRITMPLVVLAAVLVAPAAFAQSANPGTGGTAGVAGQPGNKSGPPVNPKGQPTGTGQGSTTNPDPARVPGLPGNKSGPPAKPPKQ
jgi:hypothetical protein